MGFDYGFAYLLQVYFKVDGRDEVVETLCGDTLPKPILSNGPWLMLEFRSTYNNTENKGFTADFSFVTSMFRCLLTVFELQV